MMVRRVEKTYEPSVNFPSHVPFGRAAKVAFCGWHLRQLVASARSIARVSCSRSRPRQLQLSGVEAPVLGKTILAPDHDLVVVRALPFASSPEPIACTSGPLANCLTERLASGAPSLSHALGLWLIPRHAAHFEVTVQTGRILLWIRVADADDERQAYQTFLARSSNSVGVHDLVLPGPQ